LEQIEESNSYFLSTPFSAKVNPVIRATGLFVSLISFFTISKASNLVESKTIKNRFRFFVYLPISLAFITYLIVNAYFQAKGLTLQSFEGLENCYVDYSIISSRTGYFVE